MRLVLIALITLIAAAGLAQSAHISLDSQFGPDTVTLDTSTGIEWLDLIVTFGTTTDWVEEQMAPGGTLQGWRYASRPEFFEFAAPYLILLTPGPPPCCSYTDLEIAPVLDFVELMGFRRSIDVSPMSGLLSPPIIVTLFLHPNEAVLAVEAVNHPTDCGDGGGGCGMYLVRTIPEASGAACVLAGLAFCGLLKRLRRARG